MNWPCRTCRPKRNFEIHFLWEGYEICTRSVCHWLTLAGWALYWRKYDHGPAKKPNSISRSSSACTEGLVWACTDSKCLSVNERSGKRRREPKRRFFFVCVLTPMHMCPQTWTVRQPRIYKSKETYIYMPHNAGGARSKRWMWPNCLLILP